MKLKVFPEDLTIGMYVSELDRPWIESPFLFQGFAIQSNDDIDDIKKVCGYVYVDTEKTPLDVRAQLHAMQQAASYTRPTRQRRSTDKDPISFSDSKDDSLDFKESLIKARHARDKTRAYVDDMLAQTRMGKIVDTQKARLLVAELANNIIENADASMWLTNLKNRDEYTAIHSVNVCVLSLTFGRALGLSKQQLNDLGLGALLHDMGKMRVPLEVLNKPGRLSPEEFEIMKSHPVLGYEMLLKGSTLPAEVLDVVKSHHERLNGSGYPDGLKDHNINYFTRIVSITDVYDAITSDRVYHDGMTPHQALKKMYEWTEDNFDAELMQAFIRTIGIYPVGSVVELKSGHVGLVVKLNEKQRLKPVIIMLMNRNKEYYAKRKLVNLASPMWNGSKEKPEIQRILDARELNIDVKEIIRQEALNK